QWLGMTQRSYPLAASAAAIALTCAAAWTLRHSHAGRHVYAVGSNLDAARLAGIDPVRVKCAVFAIGGLLTGVGAMLNAARFNQVPSNGGLGLEMQVIAAAVVGGAAVGGGRGTVEGTGVGDAMQRSIRPGRR